ncbi:hypothetical protein [Nevskia sp.]|uniref:hypothetical protein n=1 Tax=Nevskia sp. TaxID=1929292 RepID=UPI0025F3A8F3|nr:hypothetical protein [Nevskia sp.]
MSAALLLIVTAMALGLWRARGKGWRDPAFWLQPFAALFLAMTVLPPSIPIDGSTLTVLTPGTSAEQRRALPWFAPLAALPGADVPLRADAVPDLATALRQHPQATALRIIGNGLPPRDQAASGKRGLRFDAAPEFGIVALDAPSTAKLGTQIVIGGRVAKPGWRVALHDPSGAQVDVATLDGEGGFRLSTIARAAGAVQFELRAFDAADLLIDKAAVPLIVTAGERLSLRYRAGTPDADAKYWRRWAQDAGLTVAYRAGLSAGVQLSADDASLTPEALAASDLLVIDDRAWLQLGADEKAALLAAVERGLGLILKASGSLDAAVGAEWATLGFATTPLDAPASLTLDHRLAMRERADFTAAPVTINEAANLTPLLRADDGALLAAWHAQGAGRIAIWRLLDSYRLVLAGDAARYAALWGDTLAQLGRPLPPPSAGPQTPSETWVDERATLCGLGAAASLLSPDGQTLPLSVRADGCAAAWPGESGWYRLQTGADTWPMYVRAADDARGLRANRDRDATLRLQRQPATDAAPVRIKVPLPRWPWFLAWLIVVSLLWWRERRA